MTLSLYILGGLVLLILFLGTLAPRTYHNTLSVEISRPKEKVFDCLKLLKNHDRWSPWKKKDPYIQKEFNGADGKIGATCYWKGKKAGKGQQKITKIVEGKRVEIASQFSKPLKSNLISHWITEEINSQNTIVIWELWEKYKFPFNVIAMFTNMDEKIDKDLNEGLSTLKAWLEERKPD